MKKKPTDPTNELRDLLNNWSGILKSHFNLDPLLKRITVIDWKETESSEKYRIEANFNYQGVSHFMVLEVDKTTDEKDGLITSKILSKELIEPIFQADDIERWVFKKCIFFKLLFV